ncbi:MAG TPA: hypothetical protein VK897_09940 [Anaerolineales bacterium]|nr:hypothetical protein [Anaerolineales bacterium]
MSLDKDGVDTRWYEFRRKVLDWRNKRRNDQFDKVSLVHERSISILQNRYGYSREEAIYQLENYYSKAWLG